MEQEDESYEDEEVIGFLKRNSDDFESEDEEENQNKIIAEDFDSKIKEIKDLNEEKLGSDILQKKKR